MNLYELLMNLSVKYSEYFADFTDILDKYDETHREIINRLDSFTGGYTDKVKLVEECKAVIEKYRSDLSEIMNVTSILHHSLVSASDMISEVVEKAILDVARRKSSNVAFNDSINYLSPTKTNDYLVDLTNICFPSRNKPDYLGCKFDIISDEKEYYVSSIVNKYVDTFGSTLRSVVNNIIGVGNSLNPLKDEVLGSCSAAINMLYELLSSLDDTDISTIKTSVCSDYRGKER